jgi:phospholipid-translocating ATPase
MAENVLLRGSRVRNTEWIVACAVYTGQNTKLALNSKLTRNKMTSSEKIINKYLLFFLVIFMGLVIVSAALK